MWTIILQKECLYYGGGGGYKFQLSLLEYIVLAITASDSLTSSVYITCKALL